MTTSNAAGAAETMIDNLEAKDVDGKPKRWLETANDNVRGAK